MRARDLPTRFHAGIAEFGQARAAQALAGAPFLGSSPSRVISSSTTRIICVVGTMALVAIVTSTTVLTRINSDSRRMGRSYDVYEFRLAHHRCGLCFGSVVHSLSTQEPVPTDRLSAHERAVYE